MLEFWESFVIHTAIGIIQALLTNPAKAAKVQAVLTPLRDGLNELYPPIAA